MPVCVLTLQRPRAQVMGQAIGLPLFMALFTFLGLAVTSATVVIYGAPIVDPVQLLGKMQGVVPICISLFGEQTAATFGSWVCASASSKEVVARLGPLGTRIESLLDG